MPVVDLRGRKGGIMLSVAAVMFTAIFIAIPSMNAKPKCNHKHEIKEPVDYNNRSQSYFVRKNKR